MHMAMDAAKRPRTVLAGPYGHPFHPIAVTLPIGAWTCALVFDVAALFVRPPGFLELGAVWLIGIGIAGALLAAPLGLMDFLRLRKGDPAFRVGAVHMVLNVFILVCWAVSFYLRMLGQFNDSRTWTVISDVVLLAILGVSGYLGGMLAYRYGVRVATEATQREGFNPSLDAPRPDPRGRRLTR
ncbi:DUF2231 domain-containing protein [Kutzneria kofuensis]|uniref:Putative membrane protein n=1 Tax=Kutzneria kofuensis TaxID=103725 RepID=A0A7W9KR28_9PSEU|nr:DUF2231 domain-containing protein [Kutzneria kofuensis]MBB5897146.1 putative membrane protein [Kutzneria kofuensis]